MHRSAFVEAAIIGATAAHVKSLLGADSSGHDWWHIDRVWRNASEIGRREGADPFVVELAALLHDIADWKFHAGDDSVGPRVAAEWLIEQGVESSLVDRVAVIIGEVSFKGAGVESPVSTLEGKVVQDADRLDAIGAIGIARAFAYGGHRGRLMFDPDIPPEMHATFAEYKKNSGPTINHFYEKLLLLKDRMQTRTGLELAESRHRFMEEYLRQFHTEWNAFP